MSADAIIQDAIASSSVSETFNVMKIAAILAQIHLDTGARLRIVNAASTTPALNPFSGRIIANSTKKHVGS